MLVSMAEILNEARKKNYAVAMPYVWNEDSTRASLAAAEACNSPIILGTVGAPKMWEWAMYGRFLAQNAKVPVAINQDHGGDFDSAIGCIRAGFTSIMVDRSKLPFEENVAQVKQLTDIAHAVGVSVEAELGHVGQGVQYDEDRNAGLTDVQEASKFVAATGVDCLAVAIGTAHGSYMGEPHIDFDLLEKLASTLDIPLVLHGGSGTGDDNLARACKSGINKVNLYTDLSKTAMDYLRDAADDVFDANDHLPVLEEKAYQGFTDNLMHYIKVFGAENKA